MSELSDQAGGPGGEARLAAEGWKTWPNGGIEHLVGPLWTRREEDGWAYGFIASDRHRNQRGVVHGGMLMTFADHCLGLLAWEAAGRQPVATIELGTHFVTAARAGSFIEARGEAIRTSNSVIFMQGRLTCGDATIVTVSGIWKRLKA